MDNKHLDQNLNEELNKANKAPEGPEENAPEAQTPPEPQSGGEDGLPGPPPPIASANLPLRKPQKRVLDAKAKALIAVGCVAAVVVIALCVWFFWLKGYLAAKDAAPVFVNSVSSITGVTADTDPRYSGLVEPQKITSVNKDDTRTVAEVLVMEGDQVYVGDPLFRYDTDEMQLSIRQAELELEGIANQITSLQDQKKTLEEEKKKASKDDQFSYTVEIQSVELQIKTQEYQRSLKQSELDKLNASLDNNEVLSEVDGVIQQINLTPQTDSQGQPLPFMSILSSGEFRIKGTVTEQNINALSEGQSVVVRSRVDPESYWQGSIESIDYEPVQDNNNMYYDGGSGEKASKYNFYVTLDAPDGLILGQHVYIEPDLGEVNTRTGLWLPAMYLVLDENDTTSGYVWARDEEEKLELRPVMLGQYDQGEDLYEIVSGLEATDYIALPAEDLVAGGPTTTDPSAMTFPEGGETDPGIDALPEGGYDDGLTDVPAEGEGYYDENGNWVEGGTEGGMEGGTDGYYDEDGNWVEGSGDSGDAGNAGDTGGAIPEGGEETSGEGELQ